MSDKKPRKRVKMDYSTTSLEAYKKFCTQNPSTTLTRIQFVAITRGFNLMLMDYAMETGEKIKLPFGVGTFVVSKKKIKKTKTFEGKEYINYPIDWVKTKAAGKRIYLMNTHTDGYRCKFLWFCRESRVYRSDIRFFKASRAASRKLAQLLKQPDSIYLQLYKDWGKNGFRYNFI